MKFCDKLPKLRKNNNYSQEQLAEKLNVSRQAVSKWELGGSYPDMDKMIQMCKILNCNLDDLMDDGIISENPTDSKTHKFNINLYMKDFLNFITKSYNMFCSMKFKEKLKFLFEMSCIFLFLFLIGSILYFTLEALISNLLGYTQISLAITNMLMTIFTAVISILGLIILLHLYKIRYLDYFITIEDQNVTEKTLEEPIEKKENKYYQEKPKETVIIRDPKHSTFSFFDLFGKVILIILKSLALMCALPAVGAFVFFVCCFVLSLYHIQYSIIFLWIAIFFLGLWFLAYISTEWLYNFISNKKQHLKRLFIILIIGLILLGSSAGIAMGIYLSFEKADDFTEEDYQTEIIILPVNDNTILHYSWYEYTIDDSVEGIQLEVKTINPVSFNIQQEYFLGYDRYFLYSSFDFPEIYSLVLNDLKNQKIRNYDNSEYFIISVTLSQETQRLLDDNIKKLEETENIILRLEEELRETQGLLDDYIIKLVEAEEENIRYQEQLRFQEEYDYEYKHSLEY